VKARPGLLLAFHMAVRGVVRAGEARVTHALLYGEGGPEPRGILHEPLSPPTAHGWLLVPREDEDWTTFLLSDGTLVSRPLPAPHS
jgi:hypothetical protein